MDGTSVQWLANLPSGDRVRVNVRDATNPGFEDSAFSDVATIGTCCHLADNIMGCIDTENT